MYREIIGVVDLPKSGQKAVSVHREYETPEEALEGDADEFLAYALGAATEHCKAVVYSQLLDKADKSDPHNCCRVWILTGPAVENE